MFATPAWATSCVRNWSLFILTRLFTLASKHGWLFLCNPVVGVALTDLNFQNSVLAPVCVRIPLCITPPTFGVRPRDRPQREHAPNFRRGLYLRCSTIGGRSLEFGLVIVKSVRAVIDAEILQREVAFAIVKGAAAAKTGQWLIMCRRGFDPNEFVFCSAVGAVEVGRVCHAALIALLNTH